MKADKEEFMEQLRAKKGFICDMDGVIYRGGSLLPGVTSREEVDLFPYRPRLILNGVGDIPE